MSLALLVGPANAGKVAQLLGRYLEALPDEPFLVVPNRVEVDRVERELIGRAGALLGGWIGTFDDLFHFIARTAGERPSRPLGEAARRLLLQQLVRSAGLRELAPSAGTAGFADVLGETLTELESSLVEPEALPAGELRTLFGAYRAELDRLAYDPPERMRRRAVELLRGSFEAWSGAPLFAYGFEDLTGVQWALVEALSGRAEVTLSLPYEPGRVAFRALEPIATDLTRLAQGRIEQLPAREWYDSPVLAYLERALFGRPDGRPALDGSLRFLEAAGTRSALELVGDETLSLLHQGVSAESIALVVPAIDRWRMPIETSFGALGIPVAVEGFVRFGRTPFGHALLSLARFVWLDGSRRDLFGFLRSPYSGLARARVDFVEGRLRGRAVSVSGRVEEEATRLLGHPLPLVGELRGSDPLEGLLLTGARLLRNAYGLETPPDGEQAQTDLRAREALVTAVHELREWREGGNDVTAQSAVAALERAQIRLAAPSEQGCVYVLDLLQARTRRFDAVFLLGLEEGVFPRRGGEASLLTREQRVELEASGDAVRLVRPDGVDRDRSLFYTACTRAWKQLALVREAATDDGRPLEPSPFYDEVRSLFAPSDVELWTRRRPLSALSWELERAPTERERLRATAALAAEDPDAARSLARANGWERRIERALAAFSRPTRLVHPAVIQTLREAPRFSVTELEQFGDCSSMWLLERVVDPREIDAEVDARLRGSVAHQALYRFYSGLPRRLGVDKPEPDRLDDALIFLRECLTEAMASQVRMDLEEVERLELEGLLARDLEEFVRMEVELALPLVPRHFELSFGSDSSPVELKRGIDLGGFVVSGKIDRVDVDPFSTRGLVQDYKSGRVAHSAVEISKERRLQIPLYVLALRDLVGVEPLGGLYRALAGTRAARGMLRQAEIEPIDGLSPRDFLDEPSFWAQVEEAKEQAQRVVGRIRVGDVGHDPRGGSCPSWCDLWPMCRVARG